MAKIIPAPAPQGQQQPADEEVSTSKVDMKFLAKALIKYGASDVHIKADRPPLFRINGKLMPAKMPPLSEEHCRSMVQQMLTEEQMEDLRKKRQVDFSIQVETYGRFRCNVYFQKGTLSVAIRMIPSIIPALEELGLPAVIKDLSQRKRGLILVTGSTGAGKSTTLASMIQNLNQNQHLHILTIEDPIEFVHRDIRSAITQREVGSDTPGMNEALIGGLRQDPDVIVVGEMRDATTIRTAMTAAETGHLVISTLHTQDAKSTIERIIDVFPGDQQNQVRMQLAFNLVAVIAQRLLMRADKSGRVLACEVMIKSPSIENHILKNEIDQIAAAIANSTNYYKMQSMNQSLEALVRSGAVTMEEALKASSSPDDLKLSLSGLERGQGYRIESA